MTISVKQNNTYADATGVWVKVSGVWKQVATNGLEGLGTWAKLTGATGSPRVCVYGDWVAFEWTQDGSLTTSGGLVEALVVGAGSAPVADNSSGNIGGCVSLCAETLQAGANNILVSPKAESVGGLYTSKPSRLGEIISAGGPYGGFGAGSFGNGLGGLTADGSGVYSDITGEHLPYGSGGKGGLTWGIPTTGPVRANSGISYKYGSAAGVVIVRVPKEYDNIPSRDWVTRVDYYAEVTDGIVTDTYQERFYGDGTVRTENGRYASPEQPDDLIPCDPSVAEGWTYTDGEFTPPPPDPSLREQAIEALQEQIKDLQKDT